MRTHNIPSYQRTSKRYPCYAASPGAMINTRSLELSGLKHIFMVPKMFKPLKFYCTIVFNTFFKICVSVLPDSFYYSNFV